MRNRKQLSTRRPFIDGRHYVCLVLGTSRYSMFDGTRRIIFREHDVFAALLERTEYAGSCQPSWNMPFHY